MPPTLAAWTHDLDPFLWQISGDFGIRWYGLAYVAGFIIAWLWLRGLARRGLILLRPEQVPDVILAHVIGVMVGGRLGYVLFYQPSLLVDFGGSFPFWGVLDITSGGMASHGGIAGIILASWWSGRHFKVPTLHVLDCIAAVAPAGAFLGRLANFVNGELLGRIVARPGEDAPWWAVRFPTELLERYAELGHTPAQQRRLIEVLRTYVSPDAELTRDAIDALVVRIQHGDETARAALTPLLSARHPSQIYQALTDGLLTLAVVWFIWRRPRRPGVIVGAMLITYSLGRIATEVIRLPDAHLSVGRVAGLSRGQWLSVGTVALGVVFLVMAWRKGGPLVGGWLRGRSGRSPSEGGGGSGG